MSDYREKYDILSKKKEKLVGTMDITAAICHPNPELPKDFLSHEQSWIRTGFEDPYTTLEQEDFAKCDYECPDEITKNQ
ncbi:hypothetical protein C2G38_2169394 [Gigaspora rosea]|uniref:Uncharacterized protein n=1 Tax=Gigaspora rosea TaxID=44941 RepID=A0A397VQB9_9GLOM|nr:hypothetical protein C2G38_2169394 [Gigaspora rosea]